MPSSPSAISTPATWRRLAVEADILVTAVGKQKLVTADMVKPGAVVIDVGITLVEGRAVGDVDFEPVAEKASLLTPVPGGVGPLTIALLLANTLKAYKTLLGFRIAVCNRNADSERQYEGSQWLPLRDLAAISQSTATAPRCRPQFLGLAFTISPLWHEELDLTLGDNALKRHLFEVLCGVDLAILPHLRHHDAEGS